MAAVMLDITMSLDGFVALKDRWDPDNTFHLNANIAPRRGNDLERGRAG
jgi:hypothetical protein